MVEVRWLSDRVLVIVLIFEEDVLRLNCGYLQCGRKLNFLCCVANLVGCIVYVFWLCIW